MSRTVFCSPYGSALMQEVCHLQFNTRKVVFPAEREPKSNCGSFEPTFEKPYYRPNTKERAQMAKLYGYNINTTKGNMKFTTLKKR